MSDTYWRLLNRYNTDMSNQFRVISVYKSKPTAYDLKNDQKKQNITKK